MISNGNCNLTYYCEKNIPQELSLILPACEPFVGDQEEKFSTVINQIYTDCKEFNHLEEINYKMDFIWAINLFQKNVFINTSHGEKKLNDLRITSYQNSFLMKWEFEMENNNTESYIISPFDSEAEVPEREFLNGLEFEKIFSSDFVPLLFQRFWDTWEQRPELEHYETIIYPQIINTIQKICKLNPLISLDIIDLGGGSGILAERILKENTLTDSLRKIVVIDRNLTLIKKAEERAVNNKKLIPRHISGKKCLRISIARLTTVKVLMSLFYVE